LRPDDLTADPVVAAEIDRLRDRVGRVTALAVLTIGTPLASSLLIQHFSIELLLLTVPVFVSMVIALVLFARRAGRAARLIVLGTLVLALTARSIALGGVTSVPFTGWVIVVLLSAVLLGTRSAWLSAATGIVLGLTLLALELGGQLPTLGGAQSAAASLPISIALFLVVALLASSLVDAMQQALARFTPADRARLSLLSRYSQAAEGALFGIWEWDLTTNSVWSGPGTQGLLGEEREVAILEQWQWFDLIHPEDHAAAEDFYARLQRPPARDGRVDLRIRHTSRGWVWMRCQGTVVIGDAGRPTSLVGSLRDVTERKQLEHTLEHRATHDFLTGLPNRKHFLDKLESQLPDRPGGKHRDLAVLFVDLDGFKLINDSLGHTAGDELLIELAKRLREVISAPDIVARLGGDEFVLLLHDVKHVQHARGVVELIEKSLADPIQLAGRDVHLRTSIGILMCTSEYTSAEDVLRDADLAMYSVKGRPSQAVGVFEPTMRDQIRQTLDLDQDLALALDKRQIVPWYQPIVDLRTGELQGFEALARWIKPYGEILMPAEFIHRAEATGLVTRLDRAVLAQAAHMIGSWNRSGAQLFLSANLSARQFTDPDLVGWVEAMLANSDLVPGQLQLEITEAALLAKDAVVNQTLGGLQALGVKIALDDFGTGYSSLSYLSAFEIHVLKIDHSFVQERGELGPGPICQAIQSVADSLGIDTVAEGVENEAQREALLGLGCTKGQGFLFGAAMPPEQVWSSVARSTLKVSAS